MVKKTTKDQKSHYFSVSMSYAECEDLYRHQIKYLLVTDIEGKRIQLPKQNMQKFISPSGLQGSYQLIVDQSNKIISINHIH
ncbi:MAG: hypothetical protein ACJAVV_002894 [Alphaproteobacteria bacterium]|jgi:hypothetical protein